MKKFTASRLAEGSHVFPAQITLKDNSVTVKIPGLFSNREETFSYKNISNIRIETPVVGYSTISFHAGNTRVKAHGFTKTEVFEIRETIEDYEEIKEINATIDGKKPQRKRDYKNMEEIENDDYLSIDEKLIEQDRLFENL